MKPFFIITKKTMAVIIAVIIIALLVLSRVFSVEALRLDGSTNSKRIVYLKSLGLQVDDSDASSKEIVIPQTFDEVYKEYNSLQKKAGFDLSHFKNKKAVLYTYWLEDRKAQVHLIVYNNEIIGGDISDINVNGLMKPLVYK